MIASMTGYGSAEVSENGITVKVEVRSVNNRFCEVATHFPRSLSLRENDIKEIVRSQLSRGKINVSVSTEKKNGENLPLKIDQAAVRSYYKLLGELRKAVKIREKITLDHLLHFSDVIAAEEVESTDDAEWAVVQKAVNLALDELKKMRYKEGEQLCKDLNHRIGLIESKISDIERLSVERIPLERQRLREHIAQLIDEGIIDENRLETEIALLADKLDVTEECVRFRSHNKFFLEAINGGEAAGRKLTFLVQEMNREINTIGSKAYDSAIAHIVVETKEELEKIREQLQNME
jgi:uncharacterized protein (TIGR00255 family)